MKKWRCNTCGHIHKGEECPDLCPVCGVDSDHFAEIE